MISFIVIGRNEGKRLKLCLDSILEVVKHDCIKSWEIIYVDSKSTDSSIAIAKGFPRVNVYMITGECNAAIARNIGAKEAKGEILFFIDGDMEILPGFIPEVVENENKMKYGFVSGCFTDVVYDANWNKLYSSPRMRNNEITYEAVVGGLFMIEKELWNRTGGMDARQKRSQDYDLGLRLTSLGIPLRRYPNLIANHHMILYSTRKDYVKYVKYSALLLRKHFTNKHYIPVFIGQHYTTIAFLTSIVLALTLRWWLIGLYFLTLLYKIISIGRKQGRQVVTLRLVYNLICRDVCFWYYFIFSNSSAPKEEYQKIR